jgi:hypothetical protein
MFETFIKFLEFLLKGLSAVPKARKSALAKNLLAVHQGVEDLISNGQELLHALQEYNALSSREEREVFTKQIQKLLLRQEERVRSIQSIAAGKSIRNVLSIRLPKLHPLLLHEIEGGKGWDLRLFFDTLEQMKAEDMKLKDIEEFEGHWKTLYPSEAEFYELEGFDPADIRKAKLRLKKISALNEKLRMFLATEFTIEDLS